MATLTYTAFMSLDGHVEDAGGRFDWAMPDREVHAFANDLERSVGTHLYGRRMYETMAVWQTMGSEEAAGDPGAGVERDYAEIWRGADKVVYSTALEAPWTPRTRLERRFDPDAVRRLKASADRDISVGGATLAGHAIRAGLVDEIALLVVPVIVGGGTPALPRDVRMDLRLLDERRFAGGVVYLRYRTR